MTRSPDAYGRSARYVCAVGLGLAGLLAARGAGAAQEPKRLTVRPRELATGTQNVPGEQRLDSLWATVYVPPEAVGQRVPLVLMAPGAGQSEQEMIRWHRPFADRYGMIVLALGDYNITDAALTQVLRKFAIDPEKIAVAGSSNGGAFALSKGSANLDVFSRVAWLSAWGGGLEALYPPQPTTTRFFFAGGGLDEAVPSLKAAQTLRRAGYAVEQVIVLKPHQQRLEDYEHLWSWLQASWGRPRPAAEAVVPTVTDAVPRLTAEAVAKMTAFWTQFMRQPDLIRGFGRTPRHQLQIPVPVGREQLWLRIVDMARLAAQYPPVAADLKRAGLTARQHDAYRGAILSAQATEMALARGMIEPVAATSVLGQNVAFLRAHGELVSQLRSTGIWSAP